MLHYKCTDRKASTVRTVHVTSPWKHNTSPLPTLQEIAMGHGWKTTVAGGTQVTTDSHWISWPLHCSNEKWQALAWGRALIKRSQIFSSIAPWTTIIQLFWQCLRKTIPPRQSPCLDTATDLTNSGSNFISAVRSRLLEGFCTTKAAVASTLPVKSTSVRARLITGIHHQGSPLQQALGIQICHRCQAERPTVWLHQP